MLVHASDRGMYLSLGDHTWKEFTTTRDIKESGIMVSLGYRGEKELDNRFLYRPQVEIFGGSADYQGKTRAGEAAETTVRYYGISAKGDAAVRFQPVPGVSIMPFAGLGGRVWLRDFQDSTSVSGMPVSGYTEGWVTVHGRLGLRAVAATTAAEIFFEGGVKLPWFNRTIIDLSEGEGGTVRLEPGTRASLFAEIGVTTNRFTGSLFYDSLRFSASDVISGVFQPKSTMDLYGLKIGWRF